VVKKITKGRDQRQVVQKKTMLNCEVKTTSRNDIDQEAFYKISGGSWNDRSYKRVTCVKVVCVFKG